MNVKGGLRLKRELAAGPPHERADTKPIAEVWVDSGVFHLDSTYSYLVPQKYSHLIQVGSFVMVPFHGRDLVAVVIARSDDAGESGLREISKPIGEIPLLSPEIVTLIQDLSTFYAAHPFDLIRSAVPQRVASVEREFDVPSINSEDFGSSSLPLYLQLPPAFDRALLLSRKIVEASSKGGVLVILPDTREVSRVAEQLASLGITYAVLDSQLPRSELFRNFLALRTGSASIAIGTRSAVFAPVQNLRCIIVYNEGSENFYEQRTPGWNVRNVALLRAKNFGCELVMVGYSPSLEIGKLIDEGLVKFKGARNRVKVESIEAIHGELIPSRAIAPIRRAIAEGPVLFLVPLKGYAQAIRCAKCKNLSRCDCGGAHEQRDAGAAISCSHCGVTVAIWKCRWCQSDRPAVALKGIERHKQELGPLFPGHEIVMSNADHPVTAIDQKVLVIATPQMAPFAAEGYASVVILEGNRFLNQPDIRAEERIREMYFSHIALAKSGAPILLIQDRGNLIHNAIATWNPKILIQRDLEERSALHLPPYARVIKLVMEAEEIIRMKSALEKAITEGRLPSTTSILGPIEHRGKMALIISVDTQDGDGLISALHEFMRRRSLSKKSLPTLRIDPYSLSR